VIEESLYWRLDLQRYARMIDAWRRKRLRRDIDWARVERSIMLGFFSIRRLLESYKLSDIPETYLFRSRSFRSSKVAI
jgi:hypothetical protein